MSYLVVSAMGVQCFVMIVEMQGMQQHVRDLMKQRPTEIVFLEDRRTKIRLRELMHKASTCWHILQLLQIQLLLSQLLCF